MRERRAHDVHRAVRAGGRLFVGRDRRDAERQRGAQQIALGGASTGLALAADASGHVYIAGNYSGSPALLGNSLFAGSSALNQNVFFARFGQALSSPVLQAINSTGTLAVTSIGLAPSGAAWVSGSYNGKVTYEAGTTLGSTTATPEPMLLQFPQAPP